MRTSTFKVENRHIPVFKRVAKELGIDLLVEPIDGEQWVEAHALIIEDTSLVSIGFLAGVEVALVALVAMRNPLTETVQKLSKKIEDFKKDTDENN